MTAAFRVFTGEAGAPSVGARIGEALVNLHFTFVTSGFGFEARRNGSASVNDVTRCLPAVGYTT